ncbi:MAG: prolipoprotein diacylglyceryl transferase [Acidobacteria bacterium]|nr:prolipoprotein diacylglyceryl transferase [Acidobacteriota bacterium]
MFPKLLSYGSFTLPTYGVLVAIGFIAGVIVAVRLAQQAGLEKEAVFNLAIYAALGGMIGSKAFLIFQERAYYWRDPSRIFSMATLQSGGIFHGGLLIALLVALWYTHRAHLPFLRTADAFAPGIALGHSIGRLGCFAAGCCWGRETDLPWGVTFTNAYSNETVGVPLGVPLHPTQLYEAVVELAIFLFLYFRYRKKQFDGQIFAWYLLLYPLARFLLELLRDQPPEAYFWRTGLTEAQAVSAGLMAYAIWLLWISADRHRRAAAITIPHDNEASASRAAKLHSR